MKTKEDFINEVFNSLEGIKRPVAETDIFDQIQNRLAYKKPKVLAFSGVQLIRIAACAILLIGFNTYTCLYYSNAKKETSTQQNSFSRDYFSYLNNIQL
ncbi:MAG TPA: hypothetical protein VK590_12345 [Saprospiraceae bacterium]|nr:hypothetical protein [Saprospiraceae bacterium]